MYHEFFYTKNDNRLYCSSNLFNVNKFLTKSLYKPKQKKTCFNFSPNQIYSIFILKLQKKINFNNMEKKMCLQFCFEILEKKVI